MHLSYNIILFTSNPLNGILVTVSKSISMYVNLHTVIYSEHVMYYIYIYYIGYISCI